ncbi:D-threo-3-hydroxyaspartate dehydratase [Diplonema papillatum]|nr:D-threo-3-hydroxyaspartate dehydratase [Diplonema papillatum]
MMQAKSLEALDTPELLLDLTKLSANVERMNRKAGALGVRLRPHLKTSKSLRVADAVFGARPVTSRPICVSTLKEAEHFAAAGYADVMYAVSIAPQKLPRVAALLDRYPDLSLTLLLCDKATAAAVGAASKSLKKPFKACVEIDSDGHRAGLAPEDTRELLDVVRTLTSDADGRPTGAVFEGLTLFSSSPRIPAGGRDALPPASEAGLTVYLKSPQTHKSFKTHAPLLSKTRLARGTFDGISANYSGAGFTGMKFKAIAAETEAGSEAWVEGVKAGSIAGSINNGVFL